MKLLIIGFVWPEPKSSAAGSRMMQLIETFQSANYKITFASSAARSEHAVNLGLFQIDQVSIQINDSSFDVFIKTLQPDIVVFDRFMTEEQFGWRVIEHCPNALRILDTEDLHSLRKTRQDCFKKNKEFTIETWLQADITKREIASIYRSDITLIISEHEIEILRKALKIDSALVYYLPFMLDPLSEAEIKSFPRFEERQHFVTIGNFRHEPNYDALLYLKESIWPFIKKELPKAEMHVYGSYPMQKVTQLNNSNEGFIIQGWADDVGEVMKAARVCLAPLRFGAGLKGKFVDAMSFGTPCVTTKIGAEGLENNFGGYIADLEEEIVDKAIQLYTNQTTWESKQQDGFKLLKRFAKKQQQQMFIEHIKKIIEQLTELRAQNFIGTMLQHQTLQSTKYMSKWIEEKNKTS